MKKTLLLIGFALCLFSAEAKDVTPAQAKAIAAKYINVGGQSARKYRAAAETSETPDYYVINDSEGKGFVLVAGDDNVTPVLGYSTTGTFDYDKMPTSLKAWLDAVSADIESIRKADNGTQKAAANEDAAQVVVAPLVKTHWGQSQPYNGATPTIGGTHALTGCPATALAQIMNYYQWPVTGTGSVKYDTPDYDVKTVDVDFTKSTYDWANMLNDYTVDGDTRHWTDAQGKAVAQLMSDIGSAVRMTYGVKASGAWENDIPNALMQHFGYKAEIYYKNSYATKEWMSLIKSQLDASRPLAFGGTDFDRKAAHEFVVDGYDSHDYLHVNWGWNGSGDGYFTFAKFGDGTANYNSRMSFVTLSPNKTGEPMAEQQTVTSGTPFIMNGNDEVNVVEGEKADFAAHVVFKIQHPSYRVFDGEVRFVLKDAEGRSVKTWGQQPLATKSSSELVELDGDFTGETFDGIADGIYKLGLEANDTRSDGTRFEQWKNVAEPLRYMTLVIANGKLTLATAQINNAPLVWKSLSFNKSSISLAEKLTWKFTLDTSTDEDYFGPVILTLLNKNGGKSVRLSVSNVSVFSGLTNEFTGSMTVDTDAGFSEGSYEAAIVYQHNGKLEYATLDEPVLLTVTSNPELIVKPYVESRSVYLCFNDGSRKECEIDKVIDLDLAQGIFGLDFSYSVNWIMPAQSPIYSKTGFLLEGSCGEVHNDLVSATQSDGFYGFQHTFEIDTFSRLFYEENYGKIMEWDLKYKSPAQPGRLPVLDKDGNSVLVKVYLHDSTTSIKDVTVSSQPKEYFDIRGNRMASPAKGLNIVRMADGTVKKVMQK